MNIKEKALEFCKNAHKNQTRKDGNTPYYTHPIRVAEKVMNYSNSTDEMVCAAYLHDVLEDCKHISKEDIQKEFGDLITYYIYKLTNISKLLGIYPRKARKEYDRNRLSDAPKEVKIIKMFDRIDNLSDMNCFEKGFVRLYIEESELLLEKIGNADENIAKELKDIILKEKSKL